MQFFLLLVTSASDLPVRTIRFCSVVLNVFGVTSSLVVIHTIHGRQWLCIARGACRPIPAVNKNPVDKCDIQTTVQQLPIIFVENRNFSLPVLSLLHSTPPLGGPRLNIATRFGMQKLEWRGYPTVKKNWKYVCSFRHNPRTWQTHTTAKSALA